MEEIYARGFEVRSRRADWCEGREHEGIRRCADFRGASFGDRDACFWDLP